MSLYGKNSINGTIAAASGGLFNVSIGGSHPFEKVPTAHRNYHYAVGMSVVLGLINGDPDRPVIVTPGFEKKKFIAAPEEIPSFQSCLYYLGNSGQTGWTAFDSENLPSDEGEIHHSFPEGEEPGFCDGVYLYGNKKVYAIDPTNRSIIDYNDFSEIPGIYDQVPTLVTSPYFGNLTDAQAGGWVFVQLVNGVRWRYYTKLNTNVAQTDPYGATFYVNLYETTLAEDDLLNSTTDSEDWNDFVETEAVEGDDYILESTAYRGTLPGGGRSLSRVTTQKLNSTSFIFSVYHSFGVWSDIHSSPSDEGMITGEESGGSLIYDYYSGYLYLNWAPRPLEGKVSHFYYENENAGTSKCYNYFSDCIDPWEALEEDYWNHIVANNTGGLYGEYEMMMGNYPAYKKTLGSYTYYMVGTNGDSPYKDSGEWIRGYGASATIRPASNNNYRFGFHHNDPTNYWSSGQFHYVLMDCAYNMQYENTIDLSEELGLSSFKLSGVSDVGTDWSWTYNLFLITNDNYLFFPYEDRDADKIGIIGLDCINNTIIYHYQQDVVDEQWPDDYTQKIWCYGKYLAFNAGDCWKIVK